MARVELVIGSTNTHKVEEIRRMLASIPSLGVVPFPDSQAMGSIEEDGKTFAENAGKKAAIYAKYLYAWRGASASGRHTAAGTDDTGVIDKEAANLAREEARGLFGLDRQGTFGSRVINHDSHRLRASDVLVLADDSGIVVDALGGAPGIHSARYSGVHGDDAANNAKLLDAMRNVPDKKRNARFVCAIALATQNGVVFTVEGKVEGRIARELKGKRGFGYDPL
ncbi:MAG: hypothetical protein L6Q71_07195, partial [Planctomycetes bacterium]|nr:hypothetical protein [Planctomycetota bacterium]